MKKDIKGWVIILLILLILLIFLFFLIFLIILKKKPKRKYMKPYKPTTYILITTCILDDAPDYETRRAEYLRGIQRVLYNIHNMDRVKVIVVENNHHKSSYLDNLGVEVVYTRNNAFSGYKGDNELADIHECIDRYNMKDRDFLVKITGRYLWEPDSPFLMHLRRLHPSTECILRYGSYNDVTAPSSPVGDAVTGIIGMRVEHIKRIQYRFEKGESIEMEWANVAMKLPQHRVIALPKLGVLISPGGEHQFYRV